MTDPPIGEYALLSDCRSAALVSTKGSVDWLCFPRFDSPSVFARLLDADGGHWSIFPRERPEVSRRYLDRTMILETSFRTPSGTAILVDAMAIGRNERGHDLGKESPGVVLRNVECVEGEVALRMEYAPRPEYALIQPLVAPIEGGLLVRGGAQVLVLSSALDMTLEGGTASAEFSLAKGESAAFALHHATSWEPLPDTWSQDEVVRRASDTAEGWRAWSEMHQNYEGPWRDLVHHSGRVLQALTFEPTGAIVAAPTTSLPETIGGTRNWDYRYTWIRDASLTLEALWVAACPDEAYRFFEWMTGAVASQIGAGHDLQVMFGVGGEHDLTERELPHLSGWRGSRPVRVGNGAWEQRQLDVYGELLGAAYRLSDQLGDISTTTRRFLVEVADGAAERWQERDQGIWEVRGDPQDFLYSKLMCWVALDRAVALVSRLEGKERVEAWASAREEIRAAILDRGWSEKAGSFTQAFGSEELDASALMMAIVGFLPGDDPRMKATIDAIAERLTDERGLVYRYLTDDGLEGKEGTFLLCTFWLAHAQALAGEVREARETFQRAASYVNEVGLLSEEVDSGTGELLGNFPQAFSHIGLINAAWAITVAEGAPETEDQTGNPTRG